MKNSLITEISIRSGLSKNRLKDLLRNRKDEYKIVTAKIDNQKRVFFVPSSEMKLVQYFIIDLVLSNVEISPHATAYVKGKSIKTNVKAHIGQTYFYKTDISSFFPSISTSMISSALSKYKNFSDEDLDFILKIVAPFGKLDLGSPSSPIISNIVMKEFDEEITDSIRILNTDAVYTRYSDDITISSQYPLNKDLDIKVSQLLLSYGFKKNTKKTSFTKLKDNVKITGIFLSKDGKISVGTSFKKKLKHYLHISIEKKRWSEITNKQLLGMLSFLKDIEPRYYERLVLKYSKADKSLTQMLR